MFFREEFKRMFFSVGMGISFFIGLVIVLWHQMAWVWNPEVLIDNGIYMGTVYYNWIGGNCGHIQSFLFYFAIPVLAVLPTGYTLFDDIKSRYLYHIHVRNAGKNFIRAKIASTFITGMIPVVALLCISFILTAMKFPLLDPEPVACLGPDLLSYDVELYFEHPFLHVLLYIVIDGIFAGGMAVFSLLATYIFEHRFSVIVTPFVIFYFLFSLDQIFGSNDMSPNYFLIPGFYTHFIMEYVVGIVVIALSSFAVYILGRKS